MVAAYAAARVRDFESPGNPVGYSIRLMTLNIGM